MALIVAYPNKTALKAAVGKELTYIEMSARMPEYVADGRMIVANKPEITHIGETFYAVVVMEHGKIKSVE